MRTKIVTVTVESLSEEGFGYLRLNDADFYVIGAWPGEVVEARIVKKRKGRRWAVVEKVVKASPARIEPLEDHYLSCSPWQAFSYAEQIKFKRQMLAGIFTGIGVNIDGSPAANGDTFNGDVKDSGIASVNSIVTDFFPAEQTTGYRTKAEFGFWYEEQKLYLGFHERGKPFVLTPLPQGCKLLSPETNKVALAIIGLINKHSIPKSDLKSLIIRESKTHNRRVAVVCVKREDVTLPFSLKDIHELHGLTVTFSDPLSPASLFTKILNTEGQNYLEETITGINFKYPLDGFFQNNIPLFEKALTIMQNHIRDVVKSQDAQQPINKIVELYSGVGTIGLALSKQAETIIGIESVPSSIQFAKENARSNNINNYECYDISAEKMDSNLLANTDVLILDPPRTGLHQDVVNCMAANKPKTILYLSCNPITQARDYQLIKHLYSSTALYGFDFYPQTNHMESLLVLER